MKNDRIPTLVKIIEADSDSFTHLSALGGLDPAKSFCGADLSQVDFRFDDLAGFKFTGADLSGANLSNARNLHPSMFEGVIFDGATRWPSDFNLKTSASTVEMYDNKDENKDNNIVSDNKIEWNSDLYWKYHNSSDYNRALEYCISVKKHKSGHVLANVFEAHLLGAHFGKISEAIEILSNGLKQKPRDPNYHYFMGQILEQKKDLVGAEIHYRSALNLISMSVDSDRVSVIARLARVLFDLGMDNNDVNKIKESARLIEKAETLSFGRTKETIIINETKNKLKISC